MKTILLKKQVYLFLFFFLLLASCSRRVYYYSGDNYFWQRAAQHRIVAVLPAEMIYTGTQPKELTPEDIKVIEERESIAFEQSLYTGIMRNVSNSRCVMPVSIQDITTTQKILQDNHISIRESWIQNDKELAQLLGVDAIVRLRIQKKRYMSDLASYGIGVGREILSDIAHKNGFGVPYIPNKTGDIYAWCNIVSNNETLWNDSYKGTSNWNRPSDEIIYTITDLFGRHFPYKRRI
jgi:hypothetical protein